MNANKSVIFKAFKVLIPAIFRSSCCKNMQLVFVAVMLFVLYIVNSTSSACLAGGLAPLTVGVCNNDSFGSKCFSLLIIFVTIVYNIAMQPVCQCSSWSKSPKLWSYPRSRRPVPSSRICMGWYSSTLLVSLVDVSMSILIASVKSVFR